MILDVVGQLDGLDLALPFSVRAWFGTTFAVPDWESYVRDRSLIVVIVVARVGAESKVVAGSGSSSSPEAASEGARGARSPAF